MSTTLTPVTHELVIERKINRFSHPRWRARVVEHMGGARPCQLYVTRWRRSADQARWQVERYMTLRTRESNVVEVGRMEL